MSKKPPRAEVKARAEASENPRSVYARLLPDSIAPVCARADQEVPESATDQDWSDWFLSFEERFPAHFKAVAYRAGVDPKNLTASGRLGFANNEDPAFLPKRRK